MASYKTIATTAEGIYKDKGSKFLAFAFPIETVEEAKNIIEQYRKQYYDARHVCYAYMLGADREQYRQNDDGEPSGTAGRPIIGQINSYELTDILVIVVRYFGGILLGTSGLIVAYRSATQDALMNAAIIEKTVLKREEIHFTYEQMSGVMRKLKERNARIIEQHFESDCSIVYEIPADTNIDFSLY